MGKKYCITVGNV